MIKKLLKIVGFSLIVIIATNLILLFSCAVITHIAYSFDWFQNIVVPVILALALAGTFRLSKVKYKGNS